jgi:hypothetical protein
MEVFIPVRTVGYFQITVFGEARPSFWQRMPIVRHETLLTIGTLWMGFREPFGFLRLRKRRCPTFMGCQFMEPVVVVKGALQTLQTQLTDLELVYTGNFTDPPLEDYDILASLGWDGKRQCLEVDIFIVRGTARYLLNSLKWFSPERP